MTMQLCLGLGGAERTTIEGLHDITVGTAAGNKQVSEGWIGTSAGNKQFFALNSLSITIDSGVGWFPVFDMENGKQIGGVLFYVASVGGNVSGGSGSYSFTWFVDSGSGFLTSSGGSSGWQSADGSATTLHCIVTDTVSGLTATSNEGSIS